MDNVIQVNFANVVSIGIIAVLWLLLARAFTLFAGAANGQGS